MTENKEHQAVTRGIKHWGLSGYSSVLPRIKFGVTGQVSSPQSPTISYRHPLVAMAGRPPEPTLRYLTRQQPDTEKNKKMPNAQRKFFANAFGTFGFAPTHKANASQNQKSQANQSPPTTPNYF